MSARPHLQRGFWIETVCGTGNLQRPGPQVGKQKGTSGPAAATLTGRGRDPFWPHPSLSARVVRDCAHPRLSLLGALQMPR